MGTMKETPKIIYLTQDREDPDYIIWQSDQPANSDEGVEYVRKDIVRKDIEEVVKGIIGVIKTTMK